MIKTAVWLLGVPKERSFVERIDLSVLMSRAVRIEERMVKGVNLTDEQRRYQILCDRIEYYGNVLALDSALSKVDLGVEYLQILEKLQEKTPAEVSKGRLLATFCPANLVREQLEIWQGLEKTQGFNKVACVLKKIKFLEEALKKGWNVLELHETCVDGESEENQDLRQEFLSLKISDKVTKDAEKNAFVALRNQIRSVANATKTEIPMAINFSDLRHDVIAEILHEFVYAGGKKILLPVMYADGSRAAPFPVFAIRPRGKDAGFLLKDVKPLDVGMMSERHPELDTKVKVYWFRNQEISIGKTAAEIDKVAYEKSKTLLAAMRDEGLYKINFFQTGFQPAVVGFYRALVEELIYRSGAMAKLSVTPYYYLAAEYHEGKTWI